MAEALVNLLDRKSETPTRVYRGDLYEGDFNLSLLSDELGAGTNITEASVLIDTAVVPKWMASMWDAAKIEV